MILSCNDSASYYINFVSFMINVLNKRFGLGLGLGLEPKVLVLVLVLNQKSWS